MDSFIYYKWEKPIDNTAVMKEFQKVGDRGNRSVRALSKANAIMP